MKSQISSSDCWGRFRSEGEEPMGGVEGGSKPRTTGAPQEAGSSDWSPQSSSRSQVQEMGMQRPLAQENWLGGHVRAKGGGGGGTEI